MIRLHFDNTEGEDYASDVSRIVEIFARHGYAVSRADARAAWQHFSDTMCAGWMMLDKDDGDVFRTVYNYLIPERAE